MPVKSPANRRDAAPQVLAPREAPVTPPPQEPSGPRVSAVLVAFNQASELRRAIEALQRSSEANRIEIVIVDCGSQDDSAQLDVEYPAVQILRLPRHFGATRAMNIAVRTAKADLLFLQSPLLEVLPDTIARLADYLDADATSAAVCPLLLDPAGHPVPRAYRVPSSADLSAGVLRIMQVDPGQDDPVAVEYASRDALLARKQFIRGMNYFDERFGEHWADLDLAMQIRRAGKKIRVLPSIHATLHPGADPLRGYPEAEADRIVGAAAFLGKYQGFFPGFRFRMAAIFRALLAFNFKRLSLLLGGEHMGSQAGR
jgi:N-acetylglucosaminyl-diphospho-decaprenol L-rhamnosyltransferase